MLDSRFKATAEMQMSKLESVTLKLRWKKAQKLMLLQLSPANVIRRAASCFVEDH